VIYLILFAEFFKIGLFAVGGGYAALPFIYQFAQTHPEYLDGRAIPDMLAVAQMLPGALGVNLSVYAGLASAHAAGGLPVWGALAAAFGLVTPSIIIIIIIARMFAAFKKNETVHAVFKALRPAALGLLTAAGFGVWKLFLYNDNAASYLEMLRWKEAALFAVFFIAIVTLKKHPTWYIAAAAVIGVVLKL
jgi:chromate transporter